METSRTCALASLPPATSVVNVAVGALNLKCDSHRSCDSFFLLTGSSALFAQEPPAGKPIWKLPDLSQATFMGGINGRTLLMVGLLVSALGLLFGLMTYTKLRDLPVHKLDARSLRADLETCKTYLLTQGKFLLILEIFIGAIIIFYFGVLPALRAPSGDHDPAVQRGRNLRQLRRGLVRNPRQHFRQLADRIRQPERQALSVLRIPLHAGMSIGMVLISVELLIMLCILLFVPSDYAGPCFIGFAIGESLGAAALRVAGGIFTKIADIGSDLMKIVFKIKEDDARNPGVIADCTGDNAGDSVGPSADGFETYGVTGVALISFILLAVNEPAGQVQLLVWIFVMRVMMVISSGVSYFINEADRQGQISERCPSSTTKRR